MKLEKNNKYNGKKLLNSIKIVLLSSTLLMGCSSVKAEEIEPTPEPTPVATSTPTPIPTPEPTPELTDMEKLCVKDKDKKFRLARLYFMEYDINGDKKFALAVLQSEIGDKDVFCYNVFTGDIMFSIDMLELLNTNDCSKYVPTLDSLSNATVIRNNTIRKFEIRLDELGIEHGTSLNSNIFKDTDHGEDEYTINDIAQYYLDVLPEEYRAYAVDYVDEYNSRYNMDNYNKEKSR